MCGLVGIAGNLAFRDEMAMKKLLLMDYFRGPDSTGLAAVRSSGEVIISKLASHPLDLFEMPKFKLALTGSASKAFIGHNRAATRGVINTFNAHPFQFDHITGAHNGTLDGVSTKTLEDALGEQFPVDSQAIFAGIARLGVEETIGMLHEGKDSLTGAWALTWYDDGDNSLNMLRNKHRPLWYAYTKEFDRIFWASEWPMIEGAARLGGYDLYVHPESFHRFWQITEDVLYKWNLTELAIGGKKMPKPKVKEIKGKPPKEEAKHDPFGRSGNMTPEQQKMGFGPANNRGANSNAKKTNSGMTTTGSGGPKRVVQLVGDIHNPFSGLLSREKFLDYAKRGCGFCQCDVEYEDVGVTVIERDETILCAECSGYMNTRVYTKNDLYL